MCRVDSNPQSSCSNEFKSLPLAETVCGGSKNDPAPAHLTDQYSCFSRPSPLDACAMMRRMGMANPDPKSEQRALKRTLIREGLSAMVQEIAQQALGGAIPGVFAFNLVKGLHEIGKSGQDGRELAQRRSFVSGFLSTLGHGMDMPKRTGAESYQRALKDRTYLGYKALAGDQTRVLNSGETWKGQWQALEKHFEGGASAARQMLTAMPLAGRRQLKAQLVKQLQGKVDPREDSFVGYLKGWLLPRVH